MTKKELVKHLEKFDDDAIIQILTEDNVYYAEVDEDAPFGEEDFRHEVSIFIGERM